MNNSEFYSNKDDLASATWPNPLWAMGGYPYHPYPSVPQSTHLDLVSDPGYPSTAGSYVPGFNVAGDAAFSLAPTTDMGAFADLLTQLDSMDQNVIDPWSMPTPSFVDVNPVVAQPQPVGDPYCQWTGVTPLAPYSVAATPDSGVSPTSTTPTSQDKWEWLSDFLKIPCTAPASSPGHGGEAVWPAPEHGANLFEATTFLAGRGASGSSWPIPTASGHVASNATATYAPTTTLGKHRREAEEPQGEGSLVGINTHNVPSQKRARTSGILEAKRSAARTCHNLVARIPESRINSIPREVGRGAERLAAPNSHGIYHQSSLGPGFQQGRMVEPADGKPTGVEGSVDEEAAHRIDSTMQQQQEEAKEIFEIPRKFKTGYRLLLQASEADLAHRAVQTIKCRLCPDTKLKDFEEFKRHCKATEKHPLKIHFCARCGDFFARRDSLKRHLNQPPAECHKVTPVKAAEKRRVTQEEHENFIRRLERGLMTGEDIGRSFSQIIKGKYPESSKKRTGGSK